MKGYLPARDRMKSDIFIYWMLKLKCFLVIQTGVLSKQASSYFIYIYALFGNQ
jgi:hypothetical protein